MKDQCKNDSAAVCTSSIGRSYQKPNRKLGLPGIRRNYPPARLSWSPSSCRPLPRNRISLPPLSQPAISPVIRGEGTRPFRRFRFVPCLSRILCFIYDVIDEVATMMTHCNKVSLASPTSMSFGLASTKE